MKYFFFILTVILLYSCTSKQLVLIKSSSQKWSTVDKSSSGTNYHFVLKTFANKNDLKIDSLCIQNKLIKTFHYSVLGKSNTYTNYLSGDTILVSVNSIENSSERNSSCSCKSNDDSFIFFSHKNKSYTVNVKSMKILPELK
ncbi:MAG: hypothetical protein HY951_07885 [Bacteroidia bacterium]|nr:hypothetical protein [Bacteroidia bacterium]